MSRGQTQAPACAVSWHSPLPPLLPEAGMQVRAVQLVCICDPLIKHTWLLDAGSRHDGREDGGGPRAGADSRLLVFAAPVAARKFSGLSIVIVHSWPTLTPSFPWSRYLPWEKRTRGTLVCKHLRYMIAGPERLDEAGSCLGRQLADGLCRTGPPGCAADAQRRRPAPHCLVSGPCPDGRACQTHAQAAIFTSYGTSNLGGG